jgi:hypothetical protein
MCLLCFENNLRIIVGVSFAFKIVILSLNVVASLQK